MSMDIPTAVLISDKASAPAASTALAIAATSVTFGDNFTMYGTSMTRPALAVCRPHDGNAASAGNGNMAAIACDSRAKVDAIHAKAIELGASDEGAPGVRGDEGPQAFYGAYFRDLDGNKLCAFRIGPAD